MGFDINRCGFYQIGDNYLGNPKSNLSLLIIGFNKVKQKSCIKCKINIIFIIHKTLVHLLL